MANIFPQVTRRIESDSEDSNVEPTPKKLKRSSPQKNGINNNTTDESATPLLDRNFDTEPVEYIDTFLETLGNLFPTYDKMVSLVFQSL